VFSFGEGPPLVLVHGAAADHTTFRVVGPMFAESRAVHGIDRRGRGESGDAPTYSIEREYEDVAAVVDDLARVTGERVDVVGHSFGGRCGLGAALLTENLRRLVVYEGAPSPPEAPYQERDLLPRLASLRDEDRSGELLVTFLRDVVAMSAAELDAYRANPVWSARVAAAPTIVREIEADMSPEAGLDRLGRITIPVLQVVGGESKAEFASAAEALDDRLSNGRVVVIDGAKHAAHHTQPEEFVSLVEAFLDDPDLSD
jgi:pimeloyl-ACP methyl ester carboxylesterase